MNLPGRPVDTLVDLVRSRQPACGTTTVVAIDGPSGSGKTELARALARATGAAILTVDEYVPGWRGLERVPAVLADALAQLAIGGPADATPWDWHHDRPGTPVVLPPVPLLILDGCGSGSRVVRPFLSALIWVEAPESVRYARAMARDGDGYEPWWDVWADQEQRLFAAEGTRAAADLRLAA